ncbi:hypothetical protein ACIGZJ_17440 [Kitasatospora sp. NPDC052868]|uniref:hypothetical protein n=1 Tax=Kitasatospora sp. NPDC052868 TaxID=3364060 RepID=UPI0037CC220A
MATSETTRTTETTKTVEATTETTRTVETTTGTTDAKTAGAFRGWVDPTTFRGAVVAGFISAAVFAMVLALV